MRAIVRVVNYGEPPVAQPLDCIFTYARDWFGRFLSGDYAGEGEGPVADHTLIRRAVLSGGTHLCRHPTPCAYSACLCAVVHLVDTGLMGT